MQQLALSGEEELVATEPLGSITIRFFVFPRKAKDPAAPAAKEPVDMQVDEDFGLDGGEVNTYLEASKKGKWCIVLLLNGQRHHVMENSFIVNDLGKPYLRRRLFIIVELDGLSRKAKSTLIQGSRVGVYEGAVFQAIRARVVAALKNDQLLEKLEAEAEEELSRLEEGDQAVRNALDQLIDSHDPNADYSLDGEDAPGDAKGLFIAMEGKPTPSHVVSLRTEGTEVAGPVLVAVKPVKTLRLRPGVEAILEITTSPLELGAKLKTLTAHVEPNVEELKVTTTQVDGSGLIQLRFEPQGDDVDYPIPTKLRVFGSYEGFPDPRLFEQELVIKPVIPPPPPPQVPLKPVPTFIRVRSRVPIRLILGDADRHVSLQWDGMDELLTASPAPWKIFVACTSDPQFPGVTLSDPSDGRFEAILRSPTDPIVYPPGRTLTFQVDARGPEGKLLATCFDAVVEEPKTPEDEQDEKPRLVATDVMLTGQRRPPYKIVKINEEQYNSGLPEPWGSWSANLAACFVAPTAREPLTLIVNTGFAPFREFSQWLIQEQQSEARINEKKVKFETHVCYHMYQMYRAVQKRAEQKAANESIGEAPNEALLAQEVNRVASTLLHLMKVSR
jgi:hypothetical protein